MMRRVVRFVFVPAAAEAAVITGEAVPVSCAGTSYRKLQEQAKARIVRM